MLFYLFFVLFVLFDVVVVVVVGCVFCHRDFVWLAFVWPHTRTCFVLERVRGDDRWCFVFCIYCYIHIYLFI